MLVIGPRPAAKRWAPDRQTKPCRRDRHRQKLPAGANRPGDAQGRVGIFGNRSQVKASSEIRKIVGYRKSGQCSVLSKTCDMLPRDPFIERQDQPLEEKQSVQNLSERG